MDRGLQRMSSPVEKEFHALGVAADGCIGTSAIAPPTGLR